MNRKEMHADELAAAEKLLIASREARWTFPTSSGRPVAWDTPAWAERLVNDRRALVAAAACLARHGDHAAATELAANVWRVWVLARDEANGREFLAGVLDADGAGTPTRFRALALYGDGLLAFRLGVLGESRKRNEAALEAARISKDREAEGLALIGLSRVDLSDGRGAEAREHAAGARACLHEFEGYGQVPLHLLAQAHRLMGALDEAAAFFEESLALNRKVGDSGMVVAELHNLGHVELRRGNVDRAERCFEESAALAGATDDPYGLALRALNDAAVALARRDTGRAKTKFEEARAILARNAITLASDDARELEDLERRLRS